MDTNKNRHLKLSRRDKMRKSPITWIILLVIVIGIGVMKIFPQYSTWKEFKNDIIVMESKEVGLKEDYAISESSLKETTNNFHKEAAGALAEEIEVFPTEIDVYKIVQILEIFSIKLKDLRAQLLQDSYFDLKSINIGQTKKEKYYSTSSLNITFSSDEKNIRRFIKFLQSGEIPEEIKKLNSNDAIEDSFLEKHLMPLINIDSIGLSETTSKEKKSNKVFSVRIQATLFSH